MKIKNTFILISMFSFLLLIAGFSLAQEQPVINTTDPEVQWIWGEVVSIDSQKNEMTVKYLDYETETENNIVIAADEKTTYENINSLGQIKLQDNVSIDYVVGPAGNIAKNISIEKAESNEEEIKPEATPPVELPNQQEMTEPLQQKTE
jgi:hypothetical protein